MKTALVTGATGMDGAHLIKWLIDLGYRVVGTYRRSASGSFWRLEEMGYASHADLRLVRMDLQEVPRILSVLRETKPDEVYNLAAQSFVAASWEEPIYTADVDAMGPLRLLECVRCECPEAKFYQASSSEMVGNASIPPAGSDETTKFYPRSPYGVSKLFSHWMTRNYRESFGMFACSGILWNHEGPYRGIEFVTRKITAGVAKIVSGGTDPICLGNLDAKRDWGYAGDYVRAMWMMLNHNSPDDYVVATGECRSVKDFVDAAFFAAKIPIEWNESGAVRRSDGVRVVEIDPSFLRPAEVHHLVGNSGKARSILRWRPEVAFVDLVAMMVRADVERCTRGRL